MDFNDEHKDNDTVDVDRTSTQSPENSYSFWADQPQTTVSSGDSFSPAPDTPSEAASSVPSAEGDAPSASSESAPFNTCNSAATDAGRDAASLNGMSADMAAASDRSGAYIPNTTMPGYVPGAYPPPFYSPYPMYPQPPVPKKPSFAKKFFGAVGLGICFGVFACGTFIGSYRLYKHFFPEKASAPVALTAQKPVTTNIALTPTDTEIPVASDSSEIVSRVVEQTMPSMVSIRTKLRATSYYFGIPYQEEGAASGSGIIVGSNETDFLIATNYHVVDGATEISVILADESTHTATVKASDESADLAVLALPKASLLADTLDAIDIAVLGDSDSAKIGQMVIAIGNAMGYGRSVTVGYLSAKDREVTIDGIKMTLLQTDAAINPGNSGGALLNTSGEVIGINNAKTAETSVEGICFAIPISKATPILRDLMSREILAEEEKGYLGVRVQTLDSAMVSQYNWPNGVYVSSVTEGGSAEAAGIYAGDIITHVDGKEVVTANQLVNSVTAHRIGESVEIKLQRIENGEFKEYTFSVTLMKNPTL